MTHSDDIIRANRELVSEFLAKVQDLDNVAAGNMIGVSEGTIRRWRKGEVSAIRLSTKVVMRRFMSTGQSVADARLAPDDLDLFRDVDRIVRYVGGVGPPGKSKALKRDILNGLRMAITAREPLPQWWKDLYEKVENDEI